MTSSNPSSSTVKSPNHILTVYPSAREKLDAAFRFLKDGLLNYEAILLITDEINKDEAVTRMEKEYAGYNILDLLDKGVITILSTSQWYFINDYFDRNRNQIKWKKTVEETLSHNILIINSSRKGKVKGLRAFGDTKSFFSKDRSLRSDNTNPVSFVDNLIEYECSLEKHFPFPLKVICAYEEQDLLQLNNSQLKSLMKHHGVFQKNSMKELVNPLQNSHIILFYENQNDLNRVCIRYINEGLARGQLCVFASVLLQNIDSLKDISSKIINFEENVQNENLILVDMSNYYVEAMMDNLQGFDKFITNLMEKVNNDNKRTDKHIRLFSDCSEFLFKNKHFDECINLEKWLHKKRLEGSFLCPFSKSLIDQFPYYYYLSRVFHSNDINIDSQGNFSFEYIKNSEHQSKLISYMLKRMDVYNAELKAQ